MRKRNSLCMLSLLPKSFSFSSLGIEVAGFGGNWTWTQSSYFLLIVAPKIAAKETILLLHYSDFCIAVIRMHFFKDQKRTDSYGVEHVRCLTAHSNTIRI